MLWVKSGTYLDMPDALSVYLSICLTRLALPFLPWHWIHHPTEALRYQHLNSPITIQRSMGPHKLITPMFSKAHWLLREAKAAAWVNLSVDLLHSARGVCSSEGGIITILCSYALVLSANPAISEAWHFLFFQAKAYLVKNDWWWETCIAQMIEQRRKHSSRKTFMSHAKAFQLSSKKTKS